MIWVGLVWSREPVKAEKEQKSERRGRGEGREWKQRKAARSRGVRQPPDPGDRPSRQPAGTQDVSATK